jgi:hypothetical protein
VFEEIKDGQRLLAIIVRSDFQKDGIHFFTPDDFPQQLSYMKHPTGKIITPHVHNQVKREIFSTQEILLIKSGLLRVDFFNDQRDYLFSRILGKGDLVFLAAGGHGFKVLEELEMVGIKQGPYAKEEDKSRFEPIADELIRFD